MPKSIIAGFNGATSQGISFSWSNREGYKPGDVIKGPTKAMRSYIQQLLNGGISISASEAGGVVTVTVQGGGTIEVGQVEAPIDSWQLINNEAQKDLFEAPNSLTIEASKTGSLGSIRNDLSLYNQAQPPGTFAYSTTPGIQTLVNQMMGLLLRGTTHFPIDQPVLRHTQTVSDNYTGGGVNYSNPRRIYSTDQLLAECASFPTPLPKIYRDAINSIPEQSAGGYIWGWWKRQTSLTTAAHYKSEISTEYLLDLWTTYLFSGFTSP